MLLREIQELGYPGGVTQLKEFLSGYKHQEPEPVVRFETPPGKQMQADFTHIRRGRDPLMAFVATLGYSRSSWVRFTTDERADTWFGCLRQAFIYFGGVPQHVLFDNAGAIITERDAYGPGQHRWHNGLLAVAQEFGFTPACVPALSRQDQGQGRTLQRIPEGQFLCPVGRAPQAGWPGASM
ncbi:integrase core domain protein [Bordetella holmesii 30539]|nr:integrase core domain protein [Bordetella holmesii 30539]